MRQAKLIFLFFTLLVLSPRLIAGAVFQSAELTEADKLSAQVSGLYNEGKFDEALPLAKRVLALREKAFGTNSEPVAVALSNIAAIYLAQKNYDQARLFYLRSLAIYEKLNEADGLTVAAIVERIALLNFFKHDHDQAESMYLRSLSIREKLLGTEHADVIHSLQNLGNFYRAVGKYEKAMSIHQRIVAMKERISGPETLEAADAREDYACSLRKAGRKDEAKKVEERNASIFHTQKTKKDKKDDVADASGEVLNGKAVSLPIPPYPGAAKTGGVKGTIRVRVLISEEGEVIKACALDGPEVFYDVTERAAYGGRFTTTLKEGKPVKVVGIITYTFR